MTEKLLNIPIDTLGVVFSFHPDGAISVGDAIDRSGVEISEEEAQAKRLVAAEEHELIIRGEEKEAYNGSHTQALRARQGRGIVYGR